jgi:CRISPR system Cascade subunit CasE
MTHLTQVDLGYELAANLRLRDSYDWHQRAWECFPGRDSQTRDFLTRLDERPEGFRLLIVSPFEPTRPAWCPVDNWRSRPIPDDYFTRSRYAFQLRANPTKKLRMDNPDGSRKKNGRRVPLRQPEELAEWLQRKASASGFALLSLQTIPQGDHSFIKPGTRGTHAAVDFRGTLEVTDAAAFHRAFTAGIGLAKAFGFGLLVLAPLH